MTIEIRYIQKDEILESHIAVERANGGHGDKAALPLITEALKRYEVVAGSVIRHLSYSIQMVTIHLSTATITSKNQ